MSEVDPTVTSMETKEKTATKASGAKPQGPAFRRFAMALASLLPPDQALGLVDRLSRRAA